MRAFSEMVGMGADRERPTLEYGQTCVEQKKKKKALEQTLVGSLLPGCYGVSSWDSPDSSTIMVYSTIDIETMCLSTMDFTVPNYEPRRSFLLNSLKFSVRYLPQSRKVANKEKINV